MPLPTTGLVPDVVPDGPLSSGWLLSVTLGSDCIVSPLSDCILVSPLSDDPVEPVASTGWVVDGGSTPGDVGSGKSELPPDELPSSGAGGGDGFGDGSVVGGSGVGVGVGRSGAGAGGDGDG